MRKKYEEGFKKQAVELVESLGSLAEASRQLGIADTTIHGWIKKYGKSGLKSTSMSEGEQGELRRLRRENMELKKVNHILKSAAAFFSQDHLK